MKNPNIAKWDTGDGLGVLLFFAQSVSDMLFDYTLDTYKVPFLNTNNLGVECLRFAQLIKVNRLPAKVLDPIIDEFIYNFKKDPIMEGIYGKKVNSYVKYLSENRNNKSGNNVDEMINVFKLIISQSRDKYLEEIKKQLIHFICYDPNEKEMIEELTRLFLTELIYFGYSKSYIYYMTNQFFFEGQNPERINKHAQVEEYLNKFDLTMKTYDLYIITDESFKYFSEAISPEKIPQFGKPNITKFLKNKQRDSIIIQIKGIESLDPRSARDIGEAYLKRWASFLKFYVHRSDFKWQDEILVFEISESYPRSFPSSLKAVHMRPEKEKDRLRNEMDLINTIIIEDNRDPRSIRLLIEALGLHSDAVNANTEENQLFTFWSAIEGLLSPPADEVRINYVINKIEPLLTINYIHKLVYDAKNNLNSCGGPDVMQVVESIEEGTDQFEKCAALMAISANTKYLEKIGPFMNNNPLLINRIYRLTQKLRSGKDIENTIEMHRQRVKWHVHRIYRMRNMIAHSMDRLPNFYMSPLIENQHTYVDVILNTILNTFKENPKIKSIEDVVVKTSIDVSTHMDYLRDNRNKKCEPNNYLDLLFGPKH